MIRTFDMVRNGQASRYARTFPPSAASREAASHPHRPANCSVVLPDSVPATACTYPKVDSGSIVVAMMGAGG
jgi:hypothetical protein